MCECCWLLFSCFFFFKQKTAYAMRISDWSSAVCSSDLSVLVSPPAAPSTWPSCSATPPSPSWRSPHEPFTGHVPTGCGRSPTTEADGGPLRFTVWAPDAAEVALHIDGSDVRATSAVKGTASCRERVCKTVSITVVDGSIKKKNTK